MPSLRTVLALAVTAGVVVVATASAATTPAKPAAGGPIARAAGGDAGPPVYPSIVNVRLVRAQSLLEDATSSLDSGDSAGATKALTGVRSNMRKAWTGAKYVIDNAPPPVAGDGRARASGAPVGGSPYADQYVTAGGVMSLQHAVAVTAMGMMDNAGPDLLAAVNSTMFAALNARDAAIEYIHKLPAAPPPAGDGRARKSGAPVAAGWGTTMQGVVPDVDDEFQMADGIRATVNLSPSRKRLLDLLELQDTKTQRTINNYWPPVVGD